MRLGKKDKLQLLIVAVLLVVFTVFLLWTLKSMSAGKFVPGGAATVVADGRGDSSSSPPIFIDYDRKYAVMDFKRDPFYGTQITVAASDSAYSGKIMLTGIFWDEKVPCAIINGKVVRVGDIVEERKVVSISREKVILSDGVSDTELDIGR
jgi:hypothetical protein